MRNWTKTWVRKENPAFWPTRPQVVHPRAGGQVARLTAAGKAALLGVGIDLEDAEGVALGVDEIALPAGFGYSEFRQGYDAAMLLDDLGRCVKILNFKGANEGIGSGLRWRSFRGALEQAASGSSRFNGPVGHRQSIDLVELPSEHLGIEICGSIGVVCLDLEIDVAFIHTMILLSQRRYGNRGGGDRGSFGTQDGGTE